MNTLSENPATIPRPTAERTDTSSESSHSSDTEESEESLDEDTPLISVPKRPRKLFQNEKEGSSDHLEYDDFIPNYSINRSSTEENIAEFDNEMDTSTLQGLQQTIIELQQQLGRCTEVAQEMDQNYSPQGLSDTIKPTLFHGYENEHFERWLEKFCLYLERRRIKSESKAALAELALHLAGPAEAFYYSLGESERSSFEILCAALKVRYLSKNQAWRQWQALSTRQQSINESFDKYIADMRNMFQH